MCLKGVSTTCTRILVAGTEVCLVKMQTPGPAASLLNQVLQGWAPAFYTVSRVPGLPPVGTPELERPGGPLLLALRAQQREAPRWHGMFSKLIPRKDCIQAGRKWDLNFKKNHFERKVFLLVGQSTLRRVLFIATCAGFVELLILKALIDQPSPAGLAAHLCICLMMQNSNGCGYSFSGK